MEDPVSIGFVGIGNMGRPMASRLVAAGFGVTVFDLDARAQQSFVADSKCRGAESLGELASLSRMVIVMLPDGKVVRRAVLGDGTCDCLAPSMNPGSVLVDMSSSSPTGTQDLGGRLAEMGIHMVDAPVSGGVSGAEAGTLAIMAGGDLEVVESCRPVFEAMGNRLFHTGGLGSGHALKALNNMLSAAGLIAAAEVLLVGRRFGLEPGVMIKVLNASTGRNNSTEKKFDRFVFSRSFNSGFSLDLMLKDLTTAVDLARDMQTPLIFGSLCRELCAAARAGLGGNPDHTDVVRWFEQLAHEALGSDGGKR